MKEAVYRADTKEKLRVQTGQTVPLPTNVKQMGQEQGDQILYLEDYVVTFLKGMTRKNSMEFQFAILLGKIIHQDEKAYVFVNGALEADQIDLMEETRFTNATWSSIYDQVKKYFPRQEIIGWFITRPGLPIKLDDRFRKLHLDNFSGEHKALLLYDGMEEEEYFYLAENGELLRQGGYFIYFEKNERMQEYLIDKKKNRSIESATVDEHMVRMRKLMEEKQKKKGGGYRGIIYTATAAVAAVALIWGTGMIKEKTVQGRKDVVNAVPVDNQTVLENTSSETAIYDTVSLAGLWSGEGDSQSEQKKPAETEDLKTQQGTEVFTSFGQESEKENSQETEKHQENEGKIEESLTDQTERHSVGESEKALDGDASKEDISAVAPENDRKENLQDSSTDQSEDQTLQKTEEQDASDSQENMGAASSQNGSDGQESVPVMESGNYYKVKQGDTLASISLKMYQDYSGIERIKQANGLEDENLIVEGQMLVIP